MGADQHRQVLASAAATKPASDEAQTTTAKPTAWSASTAISGSGPAAEVIARPAACHPRGPARRSPDRRAARQCAASPAGSASARASGAMITSVAMLSPTRWVVPYRTMPPVYHPFEIPVSIPTTTTSISSRCCAPAQNAVSDPGGPRGAGGLFRRPEAASVMVGKSIPTTIAAPVWRFQTGAAYSKGALQSRSEAEVCVGRQRRGDHVVRSSMSYFIVVLYSMPGKLIASGKSAACAALSPFSVSSRNAVEK